MLGVGGAKKIYVDDLYSTYAYKGSSSSQTLSTGLDFSNEGGLTWIRRRTGSEGYVMVDTARGTSKILQSNSAGAEQGNTDVVPSFTSTGHATGTHSSVNESGADYISWNFRKCPGFFDIVTWTGNSSSTQTISHNLGCIPGSIWVKCTSNSQNWYVYHRGLDEENEPATHYLRLNQSGTEIDTSYAFNDTAPTATTFVAGIDLNENAWTYVAYVFGGGESPAATARSVKFDGVDDYFYTSAHSDYDMGTGDFTIECWAKRKDTSNNSMWTLGSYQNGMELYIDDDDQVKVYGNNGGGSDWLITTHDHIISPGVWHHYAVVRHSGTLKLYLDGALVGSTSHSSAMPNNSETTDLHIAVEISSDNSIPGSNPYFDGWISNFRVVKGSAVYTTDGFEVPREPLTNITNTKLLCCNNSDKTGTTVKPSGSSLNSTGGANVPSPTARADSPFDDPATLVFGEDGKQSIIKCGTYMGTGSETDPAIVNIGFEPDFLLLRPCGYSEHWHHFDMMRGMGGGNDIRMEINVETSSPETATLDYFDIHSKGFKAKQGNVNGTSGEKRIAYIAVRRPDGLVGKPADAGTDAFAIDTGAGQTDAPNFDSTFAVDLGIFKEKNNQGDWMLASRGYVKKKLKLNDNDGYADDSNNVFDSNVGWNSNNGAGSNHVSWMWKRGPGLDVVHYKGDNYAPKAHNLGKSPEMMWVKAVSGSGASNQNWKVYHKGLNGGSSPEGYWLTVNGTAAENTSSNSWNNTAPNASHFFVSKSGNDGETNYDGMDYIAILFASVNGISKVGSYDGTGGGNTQTITTGFQPRFLIVKCYTHASSPWYVFDTTRGWASGAYGDKYLKLESNAAEVNPDNEWSNPISTGFTVSGNGLNISSGSQKFIYYAHA